MSSNLNCGASGHGAFLRGGTRAFSLVEVVLALGVATIGLLILSALIPAGLTANRLSRDEITAMNLCLGLEADLKETPTTASASPLYQVPIPAANFVTNATLYDLYSTTSAVSYGTTADATSIYRFTVSLTGPTVGPTNGPVLANILVTWPPAIKPVAPPGASTPTNVVGAVNVDVMINRNGS